MKAQRKNTLLIIPLLLLVFGLTVRKLGWPFGSGLIVISAIWLALSSVFSGIRQLIANKKLKTHWIFAEEFLFALCILIVFFQQQYWFFSKALAWLAVLLILQILFLHRIKKLSNTYGKYISKALWPAWLRLSFVILLTFLVLAGIVLNPRQFHNFFRMSTYEEYLRNQAQGLETSKANYLIAKYRDRSADAKIKSEYFYQLARKYDAEKKYSLALRNYNLAIDIYPDNAEAYFQRGVLKLYRLELNNDIAFSSANDFSESIRLRPSHAKSYFLRGVALGYLDRKKLVCEDMHQAYRLDSSLDVKPYINKYCPTDSTGLVPLHP